MLGLTNVLQAREMPEEFYPAGQILGLKVEEDRGQPADELRHVRGGQQPPQERQALCQFLHMHTTSCLDVSLSGVMLQALHLPKKQRLSEF